MHLLEVGCELTISAHICEDGRYPSEFNIPKTVETIRLFDSKPFQPIPSTIVPFPILHLNLTTSPLTTSAITDSQLDRILQCYRLPLDIRPVNGGNMHSREVVSSSRLRQAKVLTLLEYLGAWKIVEYERLKRGGW